MSDKWPRLIRDPVHGLIVFRDNREDRLLFSLIDTPEFQRLRRVRQLGVSEFIFPGATHTRFSHSLGVLAVGRLFLNRIDELELSQAPQSLHRTAVEAACLLHDIGHGPFSHAFESVSRDDHEKRSVEIVQTADTAVHRLLADYDEMLPSLVAALIGSEVGEAESVGNMPDYLFRIVSGEFDADRADYLLRDSHFTGAPDGQFDLQWLLRQLLVDKKKGRFYFGKKAVSAVETMLFSRYHMYKNVYFHKATRAAEVMLRLSFERLRELLAQRGPDAVKAEILPEVPLVLLRAFGDKELQLGDFISLDDSVMWSFFKASAASQDEVLRMLGRGLVERDLYKCGDMTGREQAKHKIYVDGLAAAKEALPTLAEEYLIPEDAPVAKGYKPYDPDMEEPNKQIYIELPTGKIAEISKHSATVRNLTQYQMFRFYFPPEIREEMDEIIERHVKGG